MAEIFYADIALFNFLLSNKDTQRTLHVHHGLINYKDTKTKCRHLIILPVKDFAADVYWSLLIGYNTISWYFRPCFVNYRPSNILSGSSPISNRSGDPLSDRQIKNRNINLFCAGKAQDYGQHGKAERASVIRHADNLRLEGKMETRASSNLNQTFTLKQQQQEATATTSTRGERAASIVRTEGASASRRVQGSASASQQMVAKETSSAAVASTSTKSAAMMTAQQQEAAAAISSSRTNVSTAVAGALVQTAGTEAASISAVKTDKFASSLRESSSSASASYGQQKEMSVIEHHRKQSLQKQAQQQQRVETGGWSGYELAAHTGRTAAYGGRDYEYSGGLVGRRSAGGGATTGGWADRSVSQEYSSRSSAATAAYAAAVQQQEYAARSSSSAANQNRSAAASSSAVRHEASSSSAAAASSSAFRHESSSSAAAAAYQSTTQQSYRLHSHQVNKYKK
jgi:hypothetical protein